MVSKILCTLKYNSNAVLVIWVRGCFYLPIKQATNYTFTTDNKSYYLLSTYSGPSTVLPPSLVVFTEIVKKGSEVLVLWVDKAENTPEVQAVPSELDTWQGYFNTEDKVDGIISTSHVRKWKLKGVKYFFQAHTQ